MLDLDVLDHGLDHRIDAVKTGVVKLRLDRSENRVGLVLLEAAVPDLLGQQLAGLARAEIELLLPNVLHQHRRATQRTGVGDAAAHDAGAEHRGLLQGPRIFRMRLELLLELLIVEEDLHQRSRSLGLGDLGEAPGFERQGRLAALARRGFHQLHGGQRGRLIPGRLFGNGGFGRGENSRGARRQG